MIREFLLQKRGGFSGLNHFLISAMLLFLILLIPPNDFTNLIRPYFFDKNVVFALVFFFVICGAALLPDLDNLQSDGGSAASWSMGAVGAIISSVMVTISSVATSIFRGKKDVKPFTQHRFLWHSLLIPAVGIVLVYYFAPDSGGMLIDKFKESPGNLIVSNLVSLLLVFVTTYVGGAMALKKVAGSSFLSIKTGGLSVILGLTCVLFCFFFCTEHDMKILLYCVCLGYLFHLIGDMFADTGIPIFPIYFSGKWWRRFCVLGALSVKTGGTLESMLKIVFFTIDIFLFCVVFFPNIANKFLGS